MGKQSKSSENTTDSRATEPQAGKDLDEQLASLGVDVSKLEHATERLIAVIRQAPARIAAAKAAYDRAFTGADDRAMEEARNDIAAANRERDQSALKVAEFAAPLRQLEDRRAALYVAALDASTVARDEQERAHRQTVQAITRLDGCIGMNVKISSLVASLSPFMAPIVKPCVDKVEDVPARKPTCPRCGRSDDVAQLSRDKFTCTRAHHGRGRSKRSDVRPKPSDFTQRISASRKSKS